MHEEQQSVLRPMFLSWNLRNCVDIPADESSGIASFVDIHLGEYPLDGWKPYYLEVPKKGTKKDIVGRTYQVFSAKLESPRWERKRVIILPVYTDKFIQDIEQFKVVIEYWCELCIPEDVPCLALAVKCRGLYSDDREAQCVTVLVVWNDAVARIISLDWTEGPLEDCITPEWFIQSTPLMNISESIAMMRNLYNNVSWMDLYFSIFTLPLCLGDVLEEEAKDTDYPLWSREWMYYDQGKLTKAMNLLLTQIDDLFSASGGINE